MNTAHSSPSPCPSFDWQHFFDHFMQDADQLFWIVNQTKEFVYGNRRFLDFFKIDAAQMVGRPIAEMLPLAVATTFHQHIDEVLANNQDARFIQAFISHDATESYFEIKMYPVPDGVGTEGKPYDTAAVVTSYARLQLLDEVSGEAIWEWNRTRNSFYFNKTMRTLTGRDAGEGQNLQWFLHLVHPEDVVLLENKMDWSLLHARDEWEHQCRLRNGRTYENFHCRFVARYAGKDLAQLVCVLKNISEKTRLRYQLDQTNKRLRKEQAHNKVVAQECIQQRIGRELHDSVNQVLTSTKLYLEFLDPTRSDFEQIKQKSHDQLTLAIQQIRTISHDLVLPWFKEKGLLSCINGLIDDLMTTNLNVAFSCNSQQVEKLEEDFKITIYRVIQEQTKNIIAYSQAQNVNINLSLQRNNTLHLLIQDDGVGFEPNAKARKGLGIYSMTERVTDLGGQIQIDSAIGRGCLLTVVIPLNAAA